MKEILEFPSSAMNVTSIASSFLILLKIDYQEVAVTCASCWAHPAQPACYFPLWDRRTVQWGVVYTDTLEVKYQNLPTTWCVCSKQQQQPWSCREMMPSSQADILSWLTFSLTWSKGKKRWVLWEWWSAQKDCSSINETRSSSHADSITYSEDLIDHFTHVKIIFLWGEREMGEWHTGKSHRSYSNAPWSIISWTSLLTWSPRDVENFARAWTRTVWVQNTGRFH